MDFFFSNAILGILDVIAIERAGLELVREGRSAVEAEAGRTVNRATIAKLANSHMSMGSVDFGQIAPMVGESELLGTSIYYVNTFLWGRGVKVFQMLKFCRICQKVSKCLKVMKMDI